MRILVDADACPVKEIIEDIAREHSIELIMVSNINHFIRSDYAQVVMVDGADQSADIYIINLCRKRDIVITQDYGLASMVLAKGSYAMDSLGRRFSPCNIEGLLMQRYVNQKARRAGERITGPKKRQLADNSRFMRKLLQLIQEIEHEDLPQ
ncbi:MAG: YaiI/YqxD family protein [Syntrophomonadaceae bacterium]|nr:YaiI/YqxD family protein [Syntrophomonadaceae bacterium]